MNICIFIHCIYSVFHVNSFVQDYGLAKVLTYPYVIDYYWWTPVELLRRLLFILCVIILPGNLVSILAT